MGWSGSRGSARAILLRLDSSPVPTRAQLPTVTALFGWSAVRVEQIDRAGIWQVDRTMRHLPLAPTTRLPGASTSPPLFRKEVGDETRPRYGGRPFGPHHRPDRAGHGGR